MLPQRGNSSQLVKVSSVYKQLLILTQHLCLRTTESAVETLKVREPLNLKKKKKKRENGIAGVF